MPTRREALGLIRSFFVGFLGLGAVLQSLRAFGMVSVPELPLHNAIATITEARDIHELWAKRLEEKREEVASSKISRAHVWSEGMWFPGIEEKTPWGTSIISVEEAVGTIQWHRDWVERYDEVLGVLEGRLK
jgi:hypothetical protein